MRVYGQFGWAAENFVIGTANELEDFVVKKANKFQDMALDIDLIVNGVPIQVKHMALAGLT